MVKGLDVFREHFAGYEDQYVLIGGTAATLAMTEAGLEFRATAEQLIPPKGYAWLDLSARRAAGEEIDAKNIRKHGNDVIRLMQLLTPDVQLRIAPKIADDLETFLTRLMADGTYDPRQIHVELPLAEVVERLRRAYRRSGTDDEQSSE